MICDGYNLFKMNRSNNDGEHGTLHVKEKIYTEIHKSEYYVSSLRLAYKQKNRLREDY